MTASQISGSIGLLAFGEFWAKRLAYMNRFIGSAPDIAGKTHCESFSSHFICSNALEIFFFSNQGSGAD